MKELMLEHVMWIGRHLGLHWKERQGISFHLSLRFEDLSVAANTMQYIHTT